MGKTYHLSEKELLELGFSKVSARALRYVFESIGDGQTPDLTLVELNELVKDIAYTPSAATAVNDLAAKLSELEAIQIVTPSSRLTSIESKIRDLESYQHNTGASRIAMLEKKLQSLEENIFNPTSSSRMAMLERKISDLEKRLVST